MKNLGRDWHSVVGTAGGAVLRAILAVTALAVQGPIHPCTSHSSMVGLSAGPRNLLLTRKNLQFLISSPTKMPVCTDPTT